MSAIHESTKYLVEDCFRRMREAISEGDTTKAFKIEKTLLEVFNNTIDDNSKLLEEVSKSKFR